MSITKNDSKNEAMLSRSVRLKKTTLDSLKIQSEELGIGITVLIRKILERHVSPTEKMEKN